METQTSVESLIETAREAQNEPTTIGLQGKRQNHSIMEAFSYMCQIGGSIQLYFLRTSRKTKIISAHMRQGQSVGGRKWEDPKKNHLAHLQAELGLSHMWPEWGSNPHQTQRLDD